MRHAKTALTSFAFLVMTPIGTHGRAPSVQPGLSVDRHGDPLPNGALARIGTTRFRHGNWVQSLAFSGDGKRLSSSSYWHEDAVWDVATGRSLAFRCDRDKTPWHSVVSPDGSLVAGHVEEIGLCVQATGTGTERWRLPGKKNAVHALAFSKDNRWLASSDDDGNAFLWDLKTGKQSRQWKSPAKERYDQLHVFSPDGNTLVHTTPNGHIVTWDIPSGNELFHIKPKEDSLEYSVRGVSISPNGEFLATRAFLGSIRLWHLKTGKFSRELGNGLSSGPVFSPDSKTIGAVEERGGIQFWKVATGKPARSLQGRRNQKIHCLAISPDGKRLAGGADRAIHLWNLDTDKEIFPIQDHPAADASAHLLSDGKTILLRYHYEPLANYGAVDSQLDFYDVAGKLQKRVEFDFKLKNSFYSPLAMTVAPDGKSLVFAAGASFLRYHRVWKNGEIRADLRLCELSSSKELKGLNGLRCEVDNVNFSPDGQFLAAVIDKAGPNEKDYHRDRIVELWHRDAPSSLKKIAELPRKSRTVRWSPDSRWLCVGADKGCDFFDSKTGKLLRRCPDLDLSIGAVSPSGRRLVCWNFDKRTAELAEQATGKTICKLDCGGIYIVWTSFAVSPDGRVVAGDLTSENIFLWDAFTGKKIGTLNGHRGSIKSLCFSADGRFLVSGSSDTTVLIWDYRNMIQKRAGKPADLTQERLQEIWKDMQSNDAAVGYAAVSSLLKAPNQAVSFLLQKVVPMTAKDHARFEAWVDKLDDVSFHERDRAQADLNAVRDLAEPVLRKALNRKFPLESKRRVESIVARLTDPPGPIWLANLRAFETLELIGSPAARKLLEEIAAGHMDSPLTLEARRSLDRMR